MQIFLMLYNDSAYLLYDSLPLKWNKLCHWSTLFQKQYFWHSVLFSILKYIKEQYFYFSLQDNSSEKGLTFLITPKFFLPSPLQDQNFCCSEEETKPVWLNALIGRIFWDFLHEKYWADKVQQKIQQKLSKIRVREQTKITSCSLTRQNVWMFFFLNLPQA